MRQIIKVLIVEDDNFARKGLINAMPWSKHGMVVAGEASNGKAALEFIEKEKVDLILSDYSMPGMTGLELLKIVQEKYPDIMFAIITLYESFDIVQQALRYGAIDYISKLQLEEENYDNVLDNLNNLIAKNKRKKVDTDNLVQYCDTDICYVFTCVNNQDIFYLTKRFPNFFEKEPKEIGHNIYVYFLSKKQIEQEEENNRYLFHHVRHPWVVTRITGLKFYELDKFFHKMRKYYRGFLFYNNKSGEMTVTQLDDIVSKNKSISEDELHLIRQKWLSFEWISDKELFDKMLEELKSKQLAFPILFKLMVQIEDLWNKVYSMMFPMSTITLPSTFYCFSEVCEWLEKIYDLMNQFVKERSFSPDIMGSITEAILIVQNEIAEPLFATDISDRVNISRSYFHQCFKKVTGMSFNQYLRAKRVELAKYFLENTDLSIQMIAEKTGYMDEKYFSKVFRQEIGLLPSKYRKLKQNSSYKII